MSAQSVAPVVHQELCALDACPSNGAPRRENHLAAIAFNEVGSKLYASGNQDAAIEMFDAAAQAVVSQTQPCPLLSQRLHWGCQRIDGTHEGIAQFQQHPPDTYLEGECDVGPRPLRQPLHLDAVSCPVGDEFILEAMIFFNRALVYHSKSQLDDAMENYSRALEILDKNSNYVHSTASMDLVSRLGMMLHNNMAQICYIEDDEQNSILHFEAAIFWAKQINGVMAHQQEYALLFATVLSNYCRSQWIHGHIDEELHEALRRVLQLRLASLPANHADVACAHYNLGIMAYARHLNDEAKHHLKEYLSVAKTTSGSERLDPVPAMALLLLIENNGKEGKFSLELNRSLHALQEKREEYGATHLEVASLLNYVGTLLFHRKELRVAILFYREELRIEKMLMSTEADISICVTYNNIGRILQELGELPEAIGCYQKALKADVDDNSYIHAAAFAAGTCELPHVAPTTNAPSSATNLFSTIWYNLGLIHDQLGARKESITSFQMALGLRRKILGDHPDIACLWYNIGTLQTEIGKLDDATVSFQEALRIRRLGKSKDDTKYILTTLKKLSGIQQSRGNIDDALATLSEIIQIQESSSFDLQWKTPYSIGLTLRKMSDLYEAKGDLEKALASAERSYRAFRSSGAFMQPDAIEHVKAVEEVARSLIVLGSLFNETCDPIKAQAAHEEACLVVTNVLHRLGGMQHAILQPLLDSSRLQSFSRCAPVA